MQDHDFSQGLTLSMWVYPESGASDTILASSIEPTGAELGWSFGLNATRQLVFLSRDSSTTSVEVSAADSLPLDTWTHVVFTFGYGGPASGRFYVDGAESNLSVDTNTAMSAPSVYVPVVLGGRVGGVDTFVGALDRVLVMSAEATDRQVAELADSAQDIDACMPSHQLSCATGTGSCDGWAITGCETDLTGEGSGVSGWFECNRCGVFATSCDEGRVVEQLLTENCDTPTDDDGDGQINCDDSDCVGFPFCPGSYEWCFDGVDNETDGSADCADDDCDTNEYCVLRETQCGDGFDNDTDGSADLGIDTNDDGIYETPPDSDCYDRFATGIPWEICDDGVDNNGDSLTDCYDPLCEFAFRCFAGERDCFDGQDDDNDGLTDCADSDCLDLNSACAESDVRCADGVDNDGDGLVDTLDPDCGFTTEWQCDDGIDNDVDTLIDCADPNCFGYGTCPWPDPESDCSNGIDDDGINGTDCEDPNCAWVLPCYTPPEDCETLEDEDGDGSGACDDTDCVNDWMACPPSTEQECFNFWDEDQDGLADCSDPDCASTLGCGAGTGSIGDPCAGPWDCAAEGDGELCLFEQLSGVPGGYCSSWCDVMDPSSCGAGYSCLPGFLYGEYVTQGVCVEVCVNSSSCNAGELCRLLRPGGADLPWIGPPVCAPACSSHVDCMATEFCDPLSGRCGNPTEICDDPGAEDEDYDGEANEDDEDCWGTFYPFPSEVSCSDGFDNDDDGLVDCDDVDDCNWYWACHESSTFPGYVYTETDCESGNCCDNDEDDDGDGLTDCDDDDCAGLAVECPLREVECGDFEDNDEDGRSDCFDEDCACSPGVTPFGGACDSSNDCAVPWPATGATGVPICIPGGVIGGLDGICTTGCDLAANDCPAGFSCLDALLTDDSGMCLQPCINSSWCGAGYSCQVGDGYNIFSSLLGVAVGTCSRQCTTTGDCAAGSVCEPGTSLCTVVPEVCNNALDDNNDGVVDCYQPTCFGDAACANLAEDCNDAVDNDANYLVDCADPACALDENCAAGLVPIGGDCSSSADCVQTGYGALCLPIGSSSVSGGTCVSGCVPGTTICGQGTECLAIQSPGTEAAGLCMNTCVDQNDCSSSQRCMEVGAGIAGRTMGMCAPGCASDFDCATDASCDTVTRSCEPHGLDCASDCSDPRCWRDSHCVVGTETTCDDGLDRDLDGATDCDDPDCTGTSACESGTGCSTWAETCVLIPPDPAATVAGQVVVPTDSPFDQYEMLLSGPTQTQFGALIDTDGIGTMASGPDGDRLIEHQIGVIRGRVFNAAMQPVPGARVALPSHSEWGVTFTRADGEFDLMVNGGGNPLIRITHPDYITADRRVSLGWGEFREIEEVVLVEMSSEWEPMSIDSSSTPGPPAVAQFDATNDADGTRAVSLSLPAETVVTISGVPVTGTIELNVTEFTVGDHGEQAMPATLPPASAYTFAADFSMRNSSGTILSGVEFEGAPMIAYVTDFLDYPSGMTMPIGYYDPEIGHWVAEPNGMVIGLIGVDENGLAVLDAATETQITAILADVDASLAEAMGLPISDDELEALASTHLSTVTPGTSASSEVRLWRCPLSHFSVFDFNVPKKRPLPDDPPFPPDPPGKKCSGPHCSPGNGPVGGGGGGGSSGGGGGSSGGGGGSGGGGSGGGGSGGGGSGGGGSGGGGSGGGGSGGGGSGGGGSGGGGGSSGGGGGGGSSDDGGGDPDSTPPVVGCGDYAECQDMLDGELPFAPLPGGESPDCTSNQYGSIIDCETQRLREQIELSGAGASLIYDSERAGSDVARSFTIPLQWGQLQTLDYGVEVFIGGRDLNVMDEMMEHSAADPVVITWDGLNPWGEIIQTRVPYEVVISKRVDGLTAEQLCARGPAFGAPLETCTADGSDPPATRSSGYIQQRWTGFIDAELARSVVGQIGGWRLSNIPQIEPTTNTLLTDRPWRAPLRNGLQERYEEFPTYQAPGGGCTATISRNTWEITPVGTTLGSQRQATQVVVQTNGRRVFGYYYPGNQGVSGQFGSSNSGETGFFANRRAPGSCSMTLGAALSNNHPTTNFIGRIRSGTGEARWGNLMAIAVHDASSSTSGSDGAWILTSVTEGGIASGDVIGFDMTPDVVELRAGVLDTTTLPSGSLSDTMPFVLGLRDFQLGSSGEVYIIRSGNVVGGIDHAADASVELWRADLAGSMNNLIPYAPACDVDQRYQQVDGSLVCLRNVQNLQVSSSGDVYILVRSDVLSAGSAADGQVIRMDAATGLFSTIWGGPDAETEDAGNSASSTRLIDPVDLTMRETSSNGLQIYVREGARERIRVMAQDGAVSTFAGCVRRDASEECVEHIGLAVGNPGPITLPVQTIAAHTVPFMFENPAIFAGPDGMMIVDAQRKVVRLPWGRNSWTVPAGGLVPLQDHQGRAMLQHDSAGRVRSIAVPGVVRGSGAPASTADSQMSINYDSADRLQSWTTRGVDPADGRTTTLVHTTNEVRIIGEDGRETIATLDDQDRLVTLERPDGEMYRFSYVPDTMLLSTVRLPSGEVHRYDYELSADGSTTSGRLISGQNSESSRVVSYDRSNGTTSYSVTERVNSWAARRMFVRNPRLGVWERTVYDSLGFSSYHQEWRSSGERSSIAPDGTREVVQLNNAETARLGRTYTTSTAVPDGYVLNTVEECVADFSSSAACPTESLTLIEDLDTVRTRNMNGRIYATQSSLADVNGLRVVVSTTPEGRETITTLDAQGRALTIEQPGSLPLQMYYDDDGLVVATEYNVTRGTSGGLRRREFVRGASGMEEWESTVVTDANSDESRTTFDEVGRMLSTAVRDSSASPGTWVTTAELAWDIRDRLVAVIPPTRDQHEYFEGTGSDSWTYLPPSGGASCVSDLDCSAPDVCDLVAGVCVGPGTVGYVNRVSDVDGRLLREERAINGDGVQVVLEYDWLGGRCESVFVEDNPDVCSAHVPCPSGGCPSVGPTDRMHGLTISPSTDPAAGTYAYAYDSVSGALASVRSPSGERTTYTRRGPYLTEEVSEPSGGAAIRWEHDISGNIIAEVVEDADGNISRITRSYDDDLLSLGFEVDEVSPLVFAINRAAESGAPTTTTWGSIQMRTWYNELGEVTRRAGEFGGAVDPESDCDDASGYVFCEERGRDDVGRIDSERWVLPESVGSTDIELTYAYEPATRRLSSVDVGGEPGWTYGYDANGVRDSWAQLTGADADGQWPLSSSSSITPTDVVVDGADRLWSYGDLEFDWDQDGRLRERRRVAAMGSGQPDEVTCYVYDALGALRTVARHSVTGSARGVCDTISSAPAWQVDYDTDHRGRRTRRAATGEATYRFLYGDSLNPVALLDNGGRTLQRYVYLPGAHTPAAMLTYDPTTGARLARWLFVNDSRGSVRLVVNADTGAVGQRIDYGPWGEVIDDTAPGFQPFGYAGGEYDHLTGLTRFGARDYDPEVGRWTARDPIAFEGGDTNLYAYVGGDPVNGVDLTGLSGCSGEDLVDLGALFLDMGCTIIVHPGQALLCGANTISDFDQLSDDARREMGNLVERRLRDFPENQRDQIRREIYGERYSECASDGYVVSCGAQCEFQCY